jgi:hypothetical protein
VENRAFPPVRASRAEQLKRLAGPVAYNQKDRFNPSLLTFDHGKGRMDSEFGLLWIPVGFLLIFVSVAALFLTVTA